MNDYRNGSISNGGSVTSSLAGFAIGAVVGASLALLLAPESGKRTRQRLATTAQKLGQTAGEKLDRDLGVAARYGLPFVLGELGQHLAGSPAGFCAFRSTGSRTSSRWSPMSPTST